ncbi:hypothetical protein GCM10028857_29610 [Salinarchaeum chitinilyticum]
MEAATTDEADVQPSHENDGHVSDSSPATAPPSLAVATAIADATGSDPTTMAPLYETVDTDALNRLLRTDASVEIVFEYEGHAVEVQGDGGVTVDGDEIRAGDRS